jgi:Fic family protein
MNDTIKLNQRQKDILRLLSASDIPLGRDDIQTKLAASKPTIIRDLNTMEELRLIETVGSGPSTAYQLKNQNPLLEYIDMDDYYKVGFLDRDLVTQSDETFLDLLSSQDFLSEYEKNELNSINEKFIKRRDKMSPDGIKRDIERFTIELAWKSSEIEGNTYTLFETEELIKNQRAAAGKTLPETQMILNHKKALDYILTRQRDFRTIHSSDIIEIHKILVDNLDVTTDIRADAVRITNTRYEPQGSQAELRRKLERLVNIVNAKQHPIEKALILSAMIAYFQPFMDGNKRTARLAANALLMARDYSALSYRAVKDIEYKMAVIILDEQHNFYNYKKVFIDQFIDAAENYFAI